MAAGVGAGGEAAAGFAGELTRGDVQVLLGDFDDGAWEDVATGLVEL